MEAPAVDRVVLWVRPLTPLIPFSLERFSYSRVCCRIAPHSSTNHANAAPAAAGKRRTKLFPLPDDFFPPLTVSEEQADRYEDQMEEIVKKALEEYAAHEAKGPYPVYRAPWSLIGNVDALTTIRKEDPSNPTPSRARIFGRINGNYRHFIDFFYAETSRQLFEWNKFMFGYVVDTQVLRNIHTSASGRPHLYMGVKWTCLQPSTLVKRRDNVYLEYLTHTKDAKGRDVGVRVTLPLDIPECPSLPPEYKTKRIRLYTVWISRAVPNEPFVTDFFMLSENDFNGLAVTSGYYKKMMNILKDMAVFVDSRRILVQGMVTRSDWVPGESRRNCKLCSRKFHAARRRHHCRLCGEVICRRCVIVRDAPKEERACGDKTFKVVKTKFCMLCVTKMREADDTGPKPGLITASSVSNDNEGNSVPAAAASVASGTSAASTTTAEVHVESVAAPVAAKPERSDYSHSDWEYDERSSTWSETESEDGKLSLYSNSELQDDERSSVSARSDSSMDKMSFMTTLEAIQDEASDSSEKSGVELVSDFTKDVSLPSQQRAVDPTVDVAETIDTIDMLPVSRMSQRSATRMSSVSSAGGRPSATAFGSDDGDFDFFPGPRASFTHSVLSSGSLPKSPRTLDQSLAEQEELLRRMLAASGHVGYTRPASASVNASPAVTGVAAPPAAVPAVRPARTKVKLYEM